MAGQALIVTLNGLSGSAESGGKLYSYARSTSTPRALYTDLGLTTPATNPVIADALGTIVSYFDTSLEYSFTAKTADDSVTLWKADIVGGAIALTYVNPDSALSPFIETSWLSRLGSQFRPRLPGGVSPMASASSPRSRPSRRSSRRRSLRAIPSSVRAGRVLETSAAASGGG